jgi:hypothetical protein
MDFFLWGDLKTQMYATLQESAKDVRHQIMEECRQLIPDVVINVWNEEYLQHLLYLISFQ